MDFKKHTNVFKAGILSQGTFKAFDLQSISSLSEIICKILKVYENVHFSSHRDNRKGDS